MEDEENDPVKEESMAKKMEEGGDPMEEESMAKKMEEGGDPMEEEKTTTNMEEASGPMEEKTETAKTTEDEENNPDKEETTNKSKERSGPKEEETAKKMEEEKNPEKKMEAEREPFMANVISQREMMKGKMIVTDLLGLGLIPLPPRIHNLSKFERMQAGSSSRHLPSSDEVLLEHRPLKIHDKQESGKLEEEIGRIVMPSLFESNVPEPECIERVGPQMEVDCDERKAEDGPRRWRPPEKGWLKMNVEGLISEHQMATSAVVRNCNGGFLAAISGTFDPVTHVNTLTAKLLALRNALLWAETVNRVHGNYLVELNSEQVVQDLRNFATIYRMLPDGIRDIMDECLMLRMHFRRMQFASVSAGENRVAHCLASRALHHGCEGEWYAFDAPDWLQEAIMEDLPT